MRRILRRIRIIMSIALLIVLFSQVYFGMETRIAYTQDGKNFISKARLEENIEAGIARPSDYREVQIPLNTCVVGAWGEDTSKNMELVVTLTPVKEKPASSSPSGTEKLGLILVLLLISAILLKYWRNNDEAHLQSQEPINEKKANVFSENEKHKEATKEHNTAIHEDLSLANLVSKAYELNELGRYDKAIQACDGYIKSDPNNAIAWERRAFALNKLKKYDEAIAACNRSIEINSNLAYVWDNKAFALNELGRYNEAIQACERSIGIDPNNDNAWERKAFALESLGKTSEADIAFVKAYELRCQR